MTKKKSNERTDARTRLDHHEKILHLVVDRIHVQDRQIQQLTGKVNGLAVGLDEIIEWVELGWWGRLKERLFKKGGDDVGQIEAPAEAVGEGDPGVKAGEEGSPFDGGPVTRGVEES